MLRSEPSKIEFQGWGNKGSLQRRFTLHWEEEETSSGNNEATCPVILSGPMTSRFSIDGPSHLASPLMPLLNTQHRHITYTIEFHEPKDQDPESLWDAFQDQIICHTRSSYITISLHSYRTAIHKTTLYPSHFPPWKKPSERLFALIESSASKTDIRHESVAPKANLRHGLFNNKVDALNIVRRLRSKRNSSENETTVTQFKELMETVQSQDNEATERESQFYQHLLQLPSPAKELVALPPSKECSSSSDSDSENESVLVNTLLTKKLLQQTTSSSLSSEESSDDDEEECTSSNIVRHTDEEYAFYRTFIKTSLSSEMKLPYRSKPKRHLKHHVILSKSSESSSDSDNVETINNKANEKNLWMDSDNGLELSDYEET